MNMISTPSFKLAAYAKGDPKAARLALVLPGRLDTKDYPHMKSHVNFLAGLGYYALSFDPPGTWESPGDIELYTMTNYLKAIDELIEQFGNKPTLLVGHSRGGSMAMLAGCTNPHVINYIAVMSRAGESLPHRAMNLGGKYISYRDAPAGGTKDQVFELPMSYFEDSAKYNILEVLKQCDKPKLFIAGTRDEMVSLQEVEEAYQAAADPKQLIKLDSDHDYRLHPGIIEKVNELIGKFLN